MWFIFILFIFSIYLNYITAKRSKRIAESWLEQPYQPVYDIIHEYIPRINFHIPDYLIVITIIGTIIKYIIFSSDHVYLNSQCLTYSLLLRSVTVSLTVIPTCAPRPTNSQNYYSEIFNSTHDLIFSGHTIVFIFLGNILGDLLGILVQFLLPITLILARQHYTIDVIISMIVYNFFYFMLIKI